jgi:hypothetical protein
MERAKALDEATFFTEAHSNAALEGQSEVPSDLDVDTHFIAFVEATNAAGEKRVVELDGGRKRPFDRGACTDLLRVSPASLRFLVVELTSRTRPVSSKRSTSSAPRAISTST